MRIAVTGASGFIGSAACAALVEAGHEVFGYGRRPRPLHLVAQARYARWDINRCPLPDPPCVDVVLHCAAEVDDWAPLALQRRTTVAGTVAVLDTWPDARLVHVSSASVYPPWREGVVSEHDGPSRRHAGPYSRAKAEAEAVVARRATGGREVLVLRPHAVYGPGDPTLLPRLLAAVRTTRGGRRVLMVPGPASTLIHLTSLDLLAHVCRVACESGATGTVNVADAGPLRLGQALDAALVAATGSAPRRVHLPRVLVRALAVVVEAAARLGRREQAPMLTRYAVSHLAVSRVLDLTRLREELGIDPAATDLSRVRSATSPGAAAAAVTVGADPVLADGAFTLTRAPVRQHSPCVPTGAFR